MNTQDMIILILLVALGFLAVQKCMDEGVTIPLLIEYGWSALEQAIGRAASLPNTVAQEIIYNTVHRTALPPTSGPAILQLIQSRSLCQCAEYVDSFYDTLEVDVPKTGLFGWDWIHRDGHLRLHGVLVCRLPMYVDFSRVTASDVVLLEDSSGLQVRIDLPLPELGECEIQYDQLRLTCIEEHSLSDEERSRLSFELAHQMQSNASPEMERRAIESGLLETAMDRVTDDVCTFVHDLYPDAAVVVRFRDTHTPPEALTRCRPTETTPRQPVKCCRTLVRPSSAHTASPSSRL